MQKDETSSYIFGKELQTMEAYSTIWNIVLQCLVVALGSVLIAFFAWAVIMAIAVFLAEKQTRKMREERSNKRV